MVLQISCTYNFDKKVLEKKCGLYAGFYGNIVVAYQGCFLISVGIPFAAWMNMPGCYQKKSKWTFHEA